MNLFGYLIVLLSVVFSAKCGSLCNQTDIWCLSIDHPVKWQLDSSQIIYLNIPRDIPPQIENSPLKCSTGVVYKIQLTGGAINSTLNLCIGYWPCVSVQLPSQPIGYVNTTMENYWTPPQTSQVSNHGIGVVFFTVTKEYTYAGKNEYGFSWDSGLGENDYICDTRFVGYNHSIVPGDCGDYSFHTYYGLNTDVVPITWKQLWSGNVTLMTKNNAIVFGDYVFEKTWQYYDYQGLIWYYYDDQKMAMTRVEFHLTCYFQEPVPNRDGTIYIYATGCNELCGDQQTCVSLVSKEGKVLSTLQNSSLAYGIDGWFDVSYDMTVLGAQYPKSWPDSIMKFYKIEGNTLSPIVEVETWELPWTTVPGGVLLYMGSNGTSSLYKEYVDGNFYDFYIPGTSLFSVSSSNIYFRINPLKRKESIVSNDMNNQQLLFYRRIGVGKWENYMTVPYPLGLQSSDAYAVLSDFDIIYSRYSAKFFSQC
jgi:hypothetical protein